MKRPLAVTGFVFLAALAVALYFGSGAFILIGMLSFLGLVLSLKSGRLRAKKVFPLCFAVTLAAVSWLSVYNGIMIAPTEELRGREAEVTGALCELPAEQYGRSYYTLLADTVTAEDGTVLTNTKMLISTSESLSAEPYDIIKGKVSINATVSASDLAKGIRLRGYFTAPEDITVTQGTERPLYYYALKTRSYLSSRIHSLLPDEQADFISAFLLGEKSGISEDKKTDLRRAGLSHIIVISGLHLSVIAQLMMLFLTFVFRGRKRPAALICIAILICYMAITGFSPSVTRAGIMQIAVLAALVLFRSADPLSSLGLSVLIMTFIDPFSAGDVGLLLSYSATLGILLLSDRVSGFLCKKIIPVVENNTKAFTASFTLCTKALVGSFAASLSAFVFTLPVIILYFREVALWSVLSNMLVFAVIPLMIVTAFLAVIFDVSVVLSFLAVPFAYCSAVSAEYVCAVAGFTAGLPYSVINVSQSFIPYWLAAMITLAAVLYLLKNVRRRVSIFVFTLVLTFVSGFVISSLTDRGVTKIAVLDTGNGLTVAAVSGSSADIFFCGGDSSRSTQLTDYLKGTLTQRVGLLVLADRRYSTSNYAKDILEKYSVGLLEVYDEESFNDGTRSAFALAESRLSHISEQSPYNRLVLGDIMTESMVDGDNRAVLADFHGTRILICTDRTDCELLPDGWRTADFLIVYGRVFHTSVIDCDTIIITGKETDPVTKKAYESRESIYRTFDGGNVIIRVDENNKTEIRRDAVWLS